MNYELYELELIEFRFRSQCLVRDTKPSWWAKHWEREDDL